ALRQLRCFTFGPAPCRGDVLNHTLHIACMIARRINPGSKVAVGTLRPAKGDRHVKAERVASIAVHATIVARCQTRTSPDPLSPQLPCSPVPWSLVSPCNDE